MKKILKITKKVKTECPKCNDDLSWSSVGFNNKDDIEIDAFCPSCFHTVIIFIKQQKSA